MKLAKGLIIGVEDENVTMNKDTFYEMDNNFNIILKENKKLKGRAEVLENTLREILHFCNHLHNDCKYTLHDGYIRKIRNICKRELDIKVGDKENE